MIVTGRWRIHSFLFIGRAQTALDSDGPNADQVPRHTPTMHFVRDIYRVTVSTRLRQYGGHGDRMRVGESGNWQGEREFRCLFFGSPISLFLPVLVPHCLVASHGGLDPRIVIRATVLRPEDQESSRLELFPQDSFASCLQLPNSAGSLEQDLFSRRS